ncbi:protein tantalus [Episyrphus balteatus]|uniref:protein tantalus n=1 Tax=Episyrphus balteatus TaxID=286459 RepID=UPI0024855AD3|nr:protein tantalus [Episyrphus balteatus]
MERIVLGISEINFNNTNDNLTEKRPLVSKADFRFCSENWCSPINQTNEHDDDDILTKTNSVFNNDNRCWSSSPMAAVVSDESTATGDESSPQIDSDSTPPNYRRSLPPRLAKSKENSSSLFQIKRRSIQKPKRNVPIKKIYLDNKIKGNFRPSNLETIFEEPTPDKNKQLCFIGEKKIRRSLSCSDGLNITKTIVKSRRNKIKKTFGRRFALKKISLDEFIDRLNSSFDESKATTTSQSVPATPTPTTNINDDKAEEEIPNLLTKTIESNEADGEDGGDGMECGDENLN